MSNYEKTSSGIFIPKNYSVFVKPTERNMSQRKLENMKRMAEIKKYYQNNPVLFVKDFFGVEMLDAQAYIFTRTWNTPKSLWVCSRGLGKSTMTCLLLMAKGMLFNNYWSYIASGSGDQANQTFTTLENIAKKNIESMFGLTDIFMNEIEVHNAAGDGFSHSSNGFSYNLYNGSMTQTLNSNVDKKRGFFIVGEVPTFFNYLIIQRRKNSYVYY